MNVTAIKEQPRRVSERAFMVNEFAYGDYSVTLHVGWVIEDILDPASWAHIAHILDRTPGTNDAPKTGGIIRVRHLITKAHP